jgi:hypothetical protein
MDEAITKLTALAGFEQEITPEQGEPGQSFAPA